MRKLALTATGLAVLAVAAPMASAAPALQYDIAISSNKLEVQSYGSEQFNYELTLTNAGTVDPGNAGAVFAPKVKGLKVHGASGQGWNCTVDPDPAVYYAYFCEHSARSLPAGASHPPLTIFVNPDSTGSHMFIPVEAHGWRRSEQDPRNNHLKVLVTHYERP